MTSSTLKTIIAIFLIAHGLVHISLSWVPTPQPNAMRTPYFPAWWKIDTDPKWPISRLGLPANVVRTAGWVLWLVVFSAFVLAALGLFGVPGLTTLWIPLVTWGSIVSLILIGLYWHPWLPVGVLLDAAILAAIYFHIPVNLFINN